MSKSYCSSVKAWVCSLLMVEGTGTLGRFTYCSPLSSSVVAYAVTDPSHINYSTVRPQISFSDHSHVTLSLKKNNHPETSSETGKQTLSSPNSISVSLNMRLKDTNWKYDLHIFVLNSIYKDPAQEPLIDKLHKLKSNINYKLIHK